MIFFQYNLSATQNYSTAKKRHDKMHNMYWENRQLFYYYCYGHSCVWNVCELCIFIFSCMNYNGRKHHIKVKVFSYFLSLSLSILYFRIYVEIKKKEGERWKSTHEMHNYFTWLSTMFLCAYGNRWEVEIELITNDSFMKIKCSLRDMFLFLTFLAFFCSKRFEFAIF